MAVLSHPSDLQSIALDPTGQRLLTAGTSYGEALGGDTHVAAGTVALWRIDGGERLHTAEVRGLVTKAVFGAGGERVYVSSAFGPSALTATLEPAPDDWPGDVERSRYTTDNTWSDLHVHANTGRIVWLGMPQLIGEGELYLWDGWGRGKAAVKRSKQPGISAFVFGPDGKTAAFAGPLMPPGMKGIGMKPSGFSGVMNLDPVTYTAEPVLHGDLVSVLVANDSWTRLVSASLDHQATLWRPAGCQVVANMAHDAALTAAAFSPGGRLLATGTAAGAVRIWDGFRGKALSEIAWHDAEVSTLSFDPTGQELIVGLELGRVVLYDTASTVVRNSVIETGKPRMKDARFVTEAATRLLVRSEDRIEAWDALTLQLLSQLIPIDKEARIADHDAERALVIDGPRVRVLGLADGREPATVVLPDLVMFAALGTRGQRVLAASRKALRAVQAADGAADFVFDLADSEESAIVAARELSGNRLLIADRKRLHIVGMADRATLDQHAGDATHRIRTYEAGNFVSRDEPLSIVDVLVDEQLSRVLVIYGYEGANVMQPRHNEHYVVEDAQTWSLSPLAPLAPSFGNAPDGHPLNAATPVWPFGRVVTTSNDGDVDLWDLGAGSHVAGPYRQAGPVHHTALSPDAKQVAVYGQSREVAVFDLVAGEPVGRPLLHTARVASARFVRPGVIATWDEDGCVRLWDAATGLRLGPSVVFGGPVTSAAVGLCGDLIVTVMGRGVANVARIGDAVLFDTSLPSLLNFAEALCGWKITQFGIEVRATAAATAAGDAPVAMQAFRAWFDDVSLARPCFAGCPHSWREQALGYMDATPPYMASLFVEVLPAHPLVWLRLAEGVTSDDPRDLDALSQLLHVTDVDELNALARSWCAHAARLAGNAPELMQRISRVEKTLAQRESIR